MKRKASDVDIVDLSDDRDEVVSSFINSCNETYILRNIIEKATNRLSFLGLGVVMINHNHYFNNICEYFTANFHIGPFKRILQVEIRLTIVDGCYSVQYECIGELDEETMSPLFTYQYEDTDFDGQRSFHFR